MNGVTIRVLLHCSSSTQAGPSCLGTSTWPVSFYQMPTIQGRKNKLYWFQGYRGGRALPVPNLSPMSPNPTPTLRGHPLPAWEEPLASVLLTDCSQPPPHPHQEAPWDPWVSTFLPCNWPWIAGVIRVGLCGKLAGGWGGG